MKKLFFIPASLLLACVIAASSAFVYLKYFHLSGWIHNGPWNTNLSMGTSDTGIYDKAWTAMFSALSPSNVNVYYKVYTDDNGEPLHSSCDYLIQGEALDTRWWSLTVYMEDGFLIPNPQKRYSWNKYNAEFNDDGSFLINLSSQQQEGNWIPLADYLGKLSMTLRLYHPGQMFYDKPESVALPKITKENCS
ncbi:DUF1214 domain-containing protein [Maricurvus nonylphenolicus]|uniref:DUF1214 domain-containing protein n=1 Tax=Maricurvus nonylphenolicus TaxID=1008307 RepID=UPI0036F2257B